MNQLRLDPLSGRWVVVSPGRSGRPYSFVTRTSQLDTLGRPCPFCPGNEEDTPPALETYGPTGHWLVRVVPNLYPAFEGDEPFVVANRGPVFTQATAGGIHEILIFFPPPLRYRLCPRRRPHRRASVTGSTDATGLPDSAERCRSGKMAPCTPTWSAPTSATCAS